jgi:hypothetical protein
MLSREAGLSAPATVGPTGSSSCAGGGARESVGLAQVGGWIAREKAKTRRGAGGVRSVGAYFLVGGWMSLEATVCTVHGSTRYLIPVRYQVAT